MPTRDEFHQLFQTRIATLKLLSVLALLMSALQATAQPFAQPLPASPDAPMSMEKDNRDRSIRDHARAIQQYEALTLLCDGVLNGPPFQPPAPDGAAIPSTKAPQIVEFELEYPPHGGLEAPPGIAGHIRGVYGCNANFRRMDCVSRTPNWRSRGLAYEPIGLTVVLGQAGLDIYQPHVWTEPRRQFPQRGSVTSTFKKSPLAMSLDYQAAATLGNAWVFRGLVWSKDPTSRVAVWKAARPWLYTSWLTRVEYEYPQGKSDASPVLARIYGDEPSTPVAQMRWEALDAADGPTLRISLDVLEPALKDGDGAEALPVALPRRIVWLYGREASSGKRAEFPTEAYIETMDGSRLVTLRTRPTTGVQLKDEAVDATVALEGPAGDARWMYYSLLRNFFNTRRPSNEQSMLAVRDYIAPCQELIAFARATNDAETEVAATRMLADIWYAARDKKEWYAAMLSFLEAAGKSYDDSQLSMEYGWTFGYLVQYGWVRELDASIQTYAKSLETSKDATELLDLGGLYAIGGGSTKTLAAVEAALKKPLSNEQKNTALLLRAGALSSVAVEMVKTATAADLDSLLDRAEADLKAVEADPTASAVFGGQIVQTREKLAGARALVAKK